MKALVFEVWDILLCSTDARAASRVPESSLIRPDHAKSKVFVKRPHLDAFLKRMAELFVAVPYTTRSRSSADKVLDVLEPRDHPFTHRFFLDSCGNGIHGKSKNLRVLGWPMDQVIAVDDSCLKYDSHSDNVVIVPAFKRSNLEHDRVLLDLIPFLEELAKPQVTDVRPAIRQRFIQNAVPVKSGSRRRMLESVFQGVVRAPAPADQPIDQVNPVCANASRQPIGGSGAQKKVSDGEMETKVTEPMEEIETKVSESVEEMEKRASDPVQEMECDQDEKRKNVCDEQPREEEDGRIKALGSALVKILRQKVPGLNLEMRPDGFCKVEKLLELDFQTKSGVALSAHTTAEVIAAAEKLSKRLSNMVDETGAFYIGAVEGSAATDRETEQLLQKIERSRVCVHGTSKKELENIMKNGLTAASSNQKYLVMAVPEAEIVRTMRRTSKVLITVNFRRARKDKSIEFYTSENGLVFTSGCIPVKYLKEVVELPSNKAIV